jgi:hypothetical protein
MVCRQVLASLLMLSRFLIKSDAVADLKTSLLKPNSNPGEVTETQGWGEFEDDISGLRNSWVPEGT